MTNWKKGPWTWKCRTCGDVYETEALDGGDVCLWFRCGGQLLPYERRASDPEKVALVDSLRRYGGHKSHCPAGNGIPPCVCGWSEIDAALECPGESDVKNGIFKEDQ